MLNAIDLGLADIRIINHSINFALNLQENYSRNRIFNVDHKQQLRIIFNEFTDQINYCIFSRLPVVLRVGLKYICEDGKVELPPEEYRLILDAIALLRESLINFPGECEILTGSTLSEVEALVKKMKIIISN